MRCPPRGLNCARGGPSLGRSPPRFSLRVLRWQNQGLVHTSVTRSMSRPLAEHRNAYKVFRPISTRWMDNDVYGHINNVVYYSWFDTAVNGYLIERAALDMHAGGVIGLVVETQCNYFAPLSFPQAVLAGIRVASIGSTSVRYEVGLFANGDNATDQPCAAKGHFIHVYVDRRSRQPAPLPAALLSVLETLK